MSRKLFWLVLMLVLGAGAGLATHVITEKAWPLWHRIIVVIVHGWGWWIETGFHHPKVGLGAMAAVLLLVVVPQIVASIPRHVDTDPQRGYNTSQREVCFARAGHRCEEDGFLWFRCSRPAQHVDHWTPHSKGGRTSLENAVAACAHHNTSKGAKLPTFWQTQRLVMRRARYFPLDVERRPR